MSVPVSQHIESLFSFCHAPLTYEVVRRRALDCGWRLESEQPDDEVLFVEIDEGLSPLVASLAARQPFGRTLYLPLFCTEDPYDAVTGAAPTHKPDFDVAYSRAKSLFERALGAPARTGTFDFFEGTYQFAMWRGAHAVLALLQDDFDIQFGSEISAWIIECRAGDPPPDLPPHT